MDFADVVTVIIGSSLVAGLVGAAVSAYEGRKGREAVAAEAEKGRTALALEAQRSREAELERLKRTQIMSSKLRRSIALSVARRPRI